MVLALVRLEGKILNEYAEKLAYAKKKDRKILEEEKRTKTRRIIANVRERIHNLELH